MKKIVYLGVILGLLLPNFSPASAIAQDPPAKTYQPGFWQPTARVAVNRPIVIEIKNNTGELIEYNLSTDQVSPPVKIEPSQSSSIRDFSLPAYLLINLSSAIVNSASLDLKYEVIVDKINNKVVVNVSKLAENMPGNNALNISETGGIYIY